MTQETTGGVKRTDPSRERVGSKRFLSEKKKEKKKQNVPTAVHTYSARDAVALAVS